MGVLFLLLSGEDALSAMDLGETASMFDLNFCLELLRSPLGTFLFVPLYALWVTILLPGVWA